ncbi:MAG TPA: hypothetical protein VIY47_15595 [Ignavibacteriaceae bacterium]
MDIFRFLVWWWKQKSNADRIGTIIVIWTLLIIPEFYFFGLFGVLIYVGGIFLALASYFLYSWFLMIKKQWDKFQEEREREAQYIIARLGGTPIPEESKPTTSQTILQRIRGRKSSRPV